MEKEVSKSATTLSTATSGSLSVGVLLLKSVGAGYGALNIAGRHAEIEILEFSPLGARSHLIISGKSKDLGNFIALLRTADIERSLVVEGMTDKILKSYLSLESAQLKNFLIISESDFAGELFENAVSFVNLGLEIVDIRIQRTQESPSFLILTGEDAEKVKKPTNDLKRKGQNITFIPNLSDGLKKYFN